MSYVAIIIVLLAAILAVPLTLVALPGAWIVIATAAAVELWRPETFSWWTIVACALVALAGEIIELGAGAIGAARAGGSKTGAAWAVVGSILGAIAGIFIPPPIIGSILGAALGAGVGAMLAERVIKKRDSHDAARIGAGAAAGRLVSLIVKGAIAAGIATTLSVAVFL
ncbi:MAG: DUF456 family protein [Phycisphaerales bacterium]